MSKAKEKGKTLTTKSKNNKLTTKGEILQEGFEANSSLFDSFVSVRTAKSQSDVLLFVENSNNTPDAQRDEVDFFKFSDKSIHSLSGEKISLETPSESFQKRIFEEETRIEVSRTDSCSKLKTEEQDSINESSLYFDQNPKDILQNSDLSSEAKEFNSIVENVDVSSDDIVPIPVAPDVKTSIAEIIVKDENLPVENEDSDTCVSNQCPLCLKTFVLTKYLSHIKSCAAKNKLSTQQLLSALRLHKKQLAERKELGLQIPVQSSKARLSRKRRRANERKKPVDSSLQLALALSASLRDAQDDEVFQEAEALKEAGLCEEAERKLSTLEQYGFASAMPPQPRSVAGGSKIRPLPLSLLLRRSQEERERIVTEKVAIVLISEEECANLTLYSDENPVLKSKTLKEKWDKECQLWSKSCCPEDEKREAFYVESLSKFVSPSKVEVGEGLRRLSQLPGRLKTPEEDNLSEMPKPLRISREDEPLLNLGNTDISELPTPLRSDLSGWRKNFESSTHLSSLSKDWEKLVNNDVLSDVKIKCKGCLVIPAHKLVFYVRCPRILEEVKQESKEDIIDWAMVSVDSVLAFLEFVYCGRTEKILRSDNNDDFNISWIAERLDITELKTLLSTAKMSSIESNKREVKKNLFETDGEKISDNVAECFGNQDLLSDTSFTVHVHKIGNKIENMPSENLSCLKNDNVCIGRESPDMFGDSPINPPGNETETDSERDELDVLVSLMGKSSQNKNDSNQKLISLKQSESMEVGSPGGSSCDTLPSKRKKSNISLSEEEEVSVSKKRCSDLSRSECFERSGTGVTFDLTQSSNSSNHGTSEEKILEGPKNGVLSIKSTEEFDLTQSSNSSNGEVFERSKSGDNRLEEFDERDSLGDLTQRDINESPLNRSVASNEDVIHLIHDDLEPEDCNNGQMSNKSRLKTAEGSFNTYRSPQISPQEIENSILSSQSLKSDEKLLSGQFPSLLCNISSRKKLYEAEDDIVQDYIDPVWEGFDDYYQLNHSINTPLKTPVKLQKMDSLSKSLSTSSDKDKSSTKQSNASPVSFVSSITSPRKLIQTVLSPLNRNPNSQKSILSDSKSPKQISRKNLTPCSSPSVKYVSSRSNSPNLSSEKLSNYFSPAPEFGCKEIHSTLSTDNTNMKSNPSSNSTEGLCSHKTDFTKSRKRLTFQCKDNSNISERICSNISRNAANQLSPKSDTTHSKSSLRKDSLAAMQRLLDDSFEVSDSLFDTVDSLGTGNDKKEQEGQLKRDCEIVENFGSKATASAQDNAVAGGSKIRTSLNTPSPGIIVSDKITPQPDYSNMKTPTLKKELNRFGLKPTLDRRKAKLLLRYIYDQTHPAVPEPSGRTHLAVPEPTDRTEEFKQPGSLPAKSPVKSSRKTSEVVSPRNIKPSSSQEMSTIVSLDDSGSETDDPCSQMSNSSSISSAASLPEESYHEAEEFLTQDFSDSGDMRSNIQSLITGNRDLHRKVLLYEPIHLEDLMAMLKANGLKCKVNDVMDYLDEQCITFRTNSWKATNEKRRQKQKSPKKKMKPQTESIRVSPSKAQTQVVKKRGRPKKSNN